jgi:outer membrane protein
MGITPRRRRETGIEKHRPPVLCPRVRRFVDDMISLLPLHRSRYVASLMWIAMGMRAAHGDADPEAKLLDGYVGAGAMSYPVYDGSARKQMVALPLVLADYRDTFYVDLLRAGVRLWSSVDKKMALGVSAEPRFGYHAKDSIRLTGMATRRDSLEGGPTFEWELPSFSVSIAYYYDWSGVTGGRSLRFSAYRQLWDNTLWDVGAYLDIDYANSKTVTYYYGVRPNEATLARTVYQPGGTINYAPGFSGAYKLNETYALLFGSEANNLGAAAAGSPIVERRLGVTSYIGVGMIF